MAAITIDPINGNDIIDSFQTATNLQYSGTEQGLDGATMTFIYQIDYGSARIPWIGANTTVAADGKWSTGSGGGLYTTASPNGVYTFTAIANGVTATRQLIQSDHVGQLGLTESPFEAVGHAFDGETQQLASAPTFLQIDQFITAEQAGIDILQRDHIVNKGQASKLQDFFQRELQVLGTQALSGDLLSANQIAQLTALQVDTAAYVTKTPALRALQPNHDGWAMPVMPSS